MAALGKVPVIRRSEPASAVSASAITCIYDWEDCGTVLGTYPVDPPGIIATNVTDPVYEGFRALKLEDAYASGTPQAYVAWITGCLDGDIIEASFWLTVAGTAR